MAPLRIAVVGAGPAGLTFANILQRKASEWQRPAAGAGGEDNRSVPWEVTLYEAERSADARRVGGTLDLGRKTGLAALEAAGLFNRFHDFARPEGQEIRLVNHHGDTVFHYAGDATPDDDRYSPEIDRADLNRILVEPLPKGAIQWDRKLERVHAVQSNADGQEYELVFTDGSTARADVVVGADGAWSHVRALVTDQTPVYPDADATFLDIRVRAFDERFPELVDVVGKGSLYSFGGGNMMVVQRNRRDVVHVYLGLRAPPDWREHELIRDATSDRERVAILVKTLFADWGEQLRALATAAVESVDFDDGAQKAGEATLLSWPLYYMPVGVHWDHREGATLIGDAAHLMSPCAGEGVNTAMIDAMELALELARPLEKGAALEGYRAAAMRAIAAYERGMFKRVRDPAKRSADNLAHFFTAPEMTKDHVAQMFGELATTTPPGGA